MEPIERIKEKILQIEKLLAEIRSELDLHSSSGTAIPVKISKIEQIPDSEILKNEYENLYREFAAGKQGVLINYIKTKSKLYLKAFCKVNSIPVDTTKVSKDKIIEELLQWMRQRQAITNKKSS